MSENCQKIGRNYMLDNKQKMSFNKKYTGFSSISTIRKEKEN